MKRGDLYWAEVAGKRRPVLLVARKRAYEQLTAVAAAPITTTLRDLPSHLPLGTRNGLADECNANCDSLAQVLVAELVESIGELAEGQFEALDNALRYSLGLGNANR